MKSATKNKFISLFLIVLMIISLVACTVQKDKHSFGEDYLLNTYCYIELFAPGLEEVIKEALSLARDYEYKLSRTDESSDLYLLNTLDSFHISPNRTISAIKENTSLDNDLRQLILDAYEYTEKTDGLFSIYMGALSDLWNFSSPNPTAPMMDQIESVLDCNKIDLGAIAKGFIADKLADYIRENAGDVFGIINLGGNIYCLGSGEMNFSIGINSPTEGKSAASLSDRKTIGSISVKSNMSVVTSGTYERCFEENGILYHHILDPKTGYPVKTDLLSATIVGPSSQVCDALSTCCILLGKEKALELLESTQGYEGVLVLSTEEIITTSGASFNASSK